MAGKDWTDEEIRAEIGAAVKMVAEDKEKIEYQRLHGKFSTPPTKDGPQPPPEKDPPTDPPEKKKRSIWWGETTEDEK